MSTEDILRELAKLKYQLKMIGDTIDAERYPIESLILEMDWDNQQLERAHDIFEEYDKKINANDAIIWRDFEMALRNEFHIGYQNVKSIVLAFYDNDQWVEVCKAYAASFKPTIPSEFHRIMRGDK
jgi:hypothetical protein